MVSAEDQFQRTLLHDPRNQGHLPVAAVRLCQSQVSCYQFHSHYLCLCDQIESSYFFVSVSFNHSSLQ